ncbi:MAG: hypothetical protein O3C60_16625, partial [Planctomycetota bacterium]|nr:hypothetical protein [Planctomycetota bacterium]
MAPERDLGSGGGRGNAPGFPGGAPRASSPGGYHSLESHSTYTTPDPNANRRPASERYGSRRGLNGHDYDHHHHHDYGHGYRSGYGNRGSGVGVYLSVPLGSAPLGYGYNPYASPYGVYSRSYYGYRNPYSYDARYYTTPPSLGGVSNYYINPYAGGRAYADPFPDSGVLPVAPPAVAPAAEVPRAAPFIAVAANASDFQSRAEQAFREHRFDEAARLSDHATVEDPQNGKLYLFAAQAKFALGEYEAATDYVNRA